MEHFNLKAAIEQHNKRGEILDDILMTDRTIEIIQDNIRMLNGRHEELAAEWQNEINYKLNHKSNLIEQWKTL